MRDTASPDVGEILNITIVYYNKIFTGKMGIEILSFTIKDVYDKVEYLQSLGIGQTSVVKRDADIGVAQVILGGGRVE